MERLKKVEHIVEKILEIREDARKNDDILYLYVCEYFSKGISSLPLKKFLEIRHTTLCPTFETVTRARRKIFENKPELKPPKVTKRRKDMEVVYKDYAINS